MGIDRIGKGGTPPVSPSDGTGGAGAVGKAVGVEKPFSIEAAETARPASEVGAVDASSPLARLRAGEIDVNGYVDLKVTEATKGLEAMPASDLADIKQLLRDQIATDPGLLDLAKTATGATPSTPED